jgi:hypothetical protein
MRNSEEAIGKVLAGLREAEAPAGMERRILSAVEARASVRQPTTLRWAWSAAFAGVAAVSLFIAITAIHRHGQTTTQARHTVAPESTGAQVTSLQRNESITPVKAAMNVRRVRHTNDANAVLLQEMRAPSHPAPEAPLTQEEKLLLRVVHSGDPQLMAMLNPEERARQEAESEAEFQKFAEQSGKDDHESDQITE